MKRYWVILMGIIGLGLLAVPGISLAHTHTLHMGVHAKSPFDAHKTKKPLHCELLKHQHSAKLFCPHTKHIRNVETQFRADCNDSRNGALPQFQWSKTLMLCPPVVDNSLPVKTPVFIKDGFLIPAPHFDQLEKPPQHA